MPKLHRTYRFWERASAAAALAVAASLLAAGPAAAQSGQDDPDWVNPDVVQLRDDVELLRREVERLASGQAVNGDLPIAAATSGDTAVRIEQLEIQSQRLAGDVERIVFETTRAIEARDAQIAELSARIATLEAMLDVTPAASSAAAPGSGPGLSSTTTDTATGVGAAGAGAVVAAAPSLSGDGEGDGQPGSLGSIDVGASGQPAADSPIFETPEAVAAAEETPPAASGPAPTLEEALDLLRARDYAAANQALSSFIAANPSDPRVGEATYWLGETHFFAGEFDQAARAFLTSFRDYPAGEKAPNSLLRLGVTLAQLGEKDAACDSFEQVPVRYPDAPERLLRQAEIQGQRAGCS